MKKKKRKEIVRTIADVREAPARAVAPDANASERPSYPRADLISKDPEWRRWLADALRTVVGPAALAGAVSVAAAGCNVATAVDLAAQELVGEEDASAAEAHWTGIDPDKLGGVGDPCHTVNGQPCGSGGGVVMHPLPPQLDKPPAIDPTQIVPPSVPPGVPPHVDPPLVDGEVSHVRPPTPPAHPPMMRGGLRPVMPRHDIPVPGGIRPFLPEGD